MEQIEIEVFDIQFLKLGFEDFLYFAPVGGIVTGKLGGQIEAVPGIAGECFAHDQLGMLAMIAPGCIVIVDAAVHGGIHHAQGSRFVNAAVIPVKDRQTHGPKAQCGQFDVLKISVNHRVASLL